MITGISSNPRIPPVFFEYLDHPDHETVRPLYYHWDEPFLSGYNEERSPAPERAVAMREIANYGIPTYVTCEPPDAI